MQKWVIVGCRRKKFAIGVQGLKSTMDENVFKEGKLQLSRTFTKGPPMARWSDVRRVNKHKADERMG